MAWTTMLLLRLLPWLGSDEAEGGWMSREEAQGIPTRGSRPMGAWTTPPPGPLDSAPASAIDAICRATPGGKADGHSHPHSLTATIHRPHPATDHHHLRSILSPLRRRTQLAVRTTTPSLSSDPQKQERRSHVTPTTFPGRSPGKSQGSSGLVVRIPCRQRLEESKSKAEHLTPPI